MNTCTQLNSIVYLTLVKTTREKWGYLLCSISNKNYLDEIDLFYTASVKEEFIALLGRLFCCLHWVTLETQISKFNKTDWREKCWKKSISVHLFSIKAVIETGSMTLTRDSTRTRNFSRKVTQLPYQQSLSFGSEQLRKAS